MLHFIRLAATRFVAGEIEPTIGDSWINPDHIVRIDSCDTRSPAGGGQLALILTLTGGTELYVPIDPTTTTTGTDTVEQAIQTLLLDHPTQPVATFEFE